MVRLMNSLMMPVEGLRYTPRRISASMFANIVKAAYDSGVLDSYIGYQATADIIRQISGVAVPVRREKTVVEPGDTILVAKLKYRPRDPKMKADSDAQRALSVDDFEFFIVSVEEG